MVELAVILLILPDGRLVLQRRGKDAPYAPGKLGFFGGHKEEGETAEECIKRELKEESSLKVDELPIEFVAAYDLPASSDYPKDRRFYLYRTLIPSLDFEVFEGERAEAYNQAELKTRPDLSEGLRYVAEDILPTL